MCDGEMRTDAYDRLQRIQQARKPMAELTLHYTFSDATDDTRIAHPLVTLLRAVRDHGSILAAARQRHLSYRYCWGELKRWEKELSVALVHWGRTCKGASLTPQALAFLEAEEQVQQKFSEQIAQIQTQLRQTLRVLTQAGEMQPQDTLEKLAA